MPLLLIAFALRLQMALTTTYVWDEDRDWIVVARDISLDPADLKLPIREGQHPALPAYIIRAGAEIAGEGPLGYRWLGLVAGVLSVGLIAVAGLRWGGPATGLLAGSLLAFNEYHIAFSALAMARIFYLTFALVSILAFARFLEGERPRDLYVTLAAAALAFLCKETAALLLPIGLAIVVLQKRSWLKRRELYLAALLFLVLISPDVWWQLSAARDGFEAGYADHLERVSGLGVSYQPWVFFGRDAVQAALSVIDRPFFDTAGEYPTMNVVFGLMLLIGAAASTLSLRGRREPRLLFASAVVWVPLAFFTLIETRGTDVLVAPVAWNWSDIVLLPAVLLSALWISRLRPRGRWIAVGAVIVASGLSVARVQRDGLGFTEAALGACPDELAPQDGRYVPVRMTLQSCATCSVDMGDLVLEDVFLVRGAERESLLGSDLVRGARVGERDRDLELKAEFRNEGRPWVYHVSYTIPSRREGGEVPSVATSIVVTPEPSVRSRFWACEPMTPAGDDAH